MQGGKRVANSVQEGTKTQKEKNMLPEKRERVRGKPKALPSCGLPQKSNLLQ